MEQILEILRLFLELDEHLREFVRAYGMWVYAGLFAVIFAETGLVVTPFLPGDSLLFAAGALAGDGALDVRILIPLLIIAGIIGDSVNYWIGSRIGRRLAERYPRVIKPHHIARTETFYARHGGKTIVIARFLPIIRTFAPFVAGVSEMRYSRFVFFNVSGAIIWVFSMVGSGYMFGGLPWVQRNFEAVIIAIIVISLIPAVVEGLRARGRGPQEAEATRP